MIRIKEQLLASKISIKNCHKKRFKEIIPDIYNIIKEHSLLLINIGLLYLNFVDSYQKTYFSQVKQYSLYIFIIYQSSINTKYIINMMHIITYFKKLEISYLKQKLLDYYLMNLSKKVGKILVNNWFGIKIKLLNKKKFSLSINSFFYKFLKEIVIINTIFF